MLKPSFRFFIIPLGTVCTLASLSSQNVAHRGAAVAAARTEAPAPAKPAPQAAAAAPARPRDAVRAALQRLVLEGGSH